MAEAAIEVHSAKCPELKVGADLDDRLRLAHRHYQLKGWNCDPLTRASWGFGAVMGSRRLVVAIRRIRPGALPESDERPWAAR
jgi:hypothetical protein